MKTQYKANSNEKKIFSKWLHQAMLVQYTAMKTIKLVFSNLKVLSWRQAIKCEGVFLTRKNPLSPQSTAWRPNTLQYCAEWPTLSNHDNSLWKGQHRASQGKKCSSRSNSMFVKKPDPIPLTKLSLNSCQNLSLPWPNGSAGSLSWVPPGLPMSVPSILDKWGSSISRQVQSWGGSLETLSLPPSWVLVQGEQALVATLLPEGRIKSTRR